jgi:hypothetical protein
METDKGLHPKWQKEPRMTTKKTSGCMRPKWVNKWSKLLDSYVMMTMMMMMMMMIINKTETHLTCTQDEPCSLLPKRPNGLFLLLSRHFP